MKYLDGNGVSYLWSRIVALVSNVASKLTPTYTATAWAALTTDERVALYAGGCRSLRLTNGDTVTLHGLDGTGALMWLGSNKPLHNYLDNSDFRAGRVINQRGATSYCGVTTNIYSISRWIINNGKTLNIYSDHIAIDGTLSQRIPLGTLNPNKAYTLAYALYDGPINVIQNGITFWGDSVGYDEAYINLGESVLSLDWAALYEGTYTADTLPPYEYKGYAAELTECERYYRKRDYVPARQYFDNSMVFIANEQYPVPMRIDPTVTIGTVYSWASQTAQVGTTAAKNIGNNEGFNSLNLSAPSPVTDIQFSYEADANL